MSKIIQLSFNQEEADPPTPIAAALEVAKRSCELNGQVLSLIRALSSEKLTPQQEEELVKAQEGLARSLDSVNVLVEIIEESRRTERRWP